MNTTVIKKPIMVDHIRVAYDKRLIGILLYERPSKNFDVYLNNKKISTQTLSTAFKEFLLNNGYVLVPSQKKTLEGAEVIDGIKISVQKNYDEKKQLRELVINVPAFSVEQMAKNRERIVYWINKIAPGLEIDLRLSDKYVRC